jgi:hypothetical protein
MTNSICSLPVHFSVKNEVSNNDTRFLSCTIDVLHTGTNFNGSVFSKEVVERNLDTIKNTPILGFIQETSDGEYDFKGHEYIITKDENGVRRKNIGSAWGVIPESCNPRWYNKTLDSGEEVEMLQVDALLWSKLEDSCDIMLRDIEKGQSMELCPTNIEGYEDPNTGLFHFTKFSFDGCTILGNKVSPAMQDANITINFTVSDFVKSIQSELINKYSAFAKLVNDTTFTNMVNEESNQGGIETMPNTDFGQTVLEQFSDISAMVSQYEAMVDRWGDNVPRFYLQDIQDNEVIVVDRKDNYHYYGYQFTMNGDKAEIDFANGNRKKIRYENYESNVTVPEGSFDFGKHIAEIEESTFAKVNEANAKAETAEQEKTVAETNYTTIKADYDEIKPKYDAYVLADEQRQAAELDAQKNAKFAEYEDVLSEDVNFAALKERKNELSVDEIEKECAVLYVKANRTRANFSKSNGASLTVGIMSDGDGVPEGYVKTRWGLIPVKQ